MDAVGHTELHPFVVPGCDFVYAPWFDSICMCVLEREKLVSIVTILVLRDTS